MNTERHPGRFALERMIAGDLMAAERDHLASHLSGCEGCRALLGQLEADRAAFAREVPYAEFRIEHEARRARLATPKLSLGRWRFALPAFAASAALAAIVLFVLPSGDPSGIGQTPPTDGTRVKGAGVGLSFHVESADGPLRPGITGESLPAGARIQLAYDAGDATHLALLGKNAAGEVTVYFPDKGERLAPVPEGQSGRFPFSLTLDGTSGRERFVAVFAHGAAPLAPVLAALAQQSHDSAETLTLPDGYAESSVWIRHP